MRRLLLPLALTGGLVLTAACTAPSKGALILAMSTDMQTPKDIDVVALYVQTDGVTKFDYIGRVLPNGSLSLPSTLAVVEPDNPDAQVRIRIVAFQTRGTGQPAKARVVRDIVTTVPHERTALMRLPLNFLDDGSAQGMLPAQFVPDSLAPVPVPEGDMPNYDPTDPVPGDPSYLATTCDFVGKGQTSVAGACVDATVDSSKAPDYSDDLVFGNGGMPGNPTCFSVQSCFANGAPLQGGGSGGAPDAGAAADAGFGDGGVKGGGGGGGPASDGGTSTMTAAGITMNADGTCSFPIAANETGQNWNCALETTDGTGTCIGANGGPPCLVPLESDPGEGFTVTPGQNVTMVAGVCKQIKNGATLWLDKSSCAAKVEAAPVCEPNPLQPIATDDGGALPADSGTTADAAPARDGGAVSEAGGGSDASTQGGDAGAPPDSGAGADSGIPMDSGADGTVTDATTDSPGSDGGGPTDGSGG